MSEEVLSERSPFPPFDETSAWAKVLGAEAAWNTR